jgi:cobalt-zinc-cadmium efflux system outer membrane protein
VNDWPGLQLDALRGTRIQLATTASGESPTELTLDDVINTTLLADPKLRAGFESINEANGDALSAALAPNPKVEIIQTLLPLTRPFTPVRQGGPPQLDVWMSYPIDWFLFGKQAAELRVASLGVQAARADFADRIRLRVQEAAIAFYGLVEAQALVELARRDANSLKRLESSVARAVADGARPRAELSRIRLDRLRAERELRDAEKEQVQAAATLAAVMGRTEPLTGISLPQLPDEMPQMELPTREECLALAEANRPDLAALRWRAAQANAEMVSARLKAYPEITPQAGYTRQFQRRAIGFPDANSYDVGVELSLPVFDRNQGGRERTAASAVRQQLELQAYLIELQAEIVRTLSEVQTAHANMKSVVEEQLAAAADVRDSVLQAGKEGDQPLSDLLDALRSYSETYRLCIQSRADYCRAVVRLNAALGRKVMP